MILARLNAMHSSSIVFGFQVGMSYIVTHYIVIVLLENIDLLSPWLQFKVGHVPKPV